MELGIIVGLVVFGLGLIVGLPICWVFLASATVALILLGSPFLFLAGTAYYSLDNWILMAVAFFIFAGGLMAESGMADRLLRLSYLLVGKVKGGLVAVGILTSVFLGALTGSAIPCIATLIPLLVPRLEKYGYEKRYTTAVLCSSSFLGYLIPPSVPVLFYCLFAQQSVAAVFLATVFPGLLLAAGYMVLNYFICHKYRHPAREIPELPSTFKEAVKGTGLATWFALPALSVPLIVLGGIYGGVFTPNEAGAIGIVVTLFIGTFIYRQLKISNFWRITQSTLIILGMYTLLLIFGMIFARVMIRAGAAQALASLALEMFQDKYLILFMLNILLLIMGMFIDGAPIEIIVVPLILPLVSGIGVNMVHLGAIIVVDIGLGVVTPPYAISIFVGSRLSGVPYDQLVKPMMFFLVFVGLPVLFVTTYVPALSCWLPTVVMGSKLVGAW